MKLQEFIDKYNGKFVEAGGSANAQNQCVDLVNAYIEEVSGLPKILWTNAVNFPVQAGDKYNFIINTPEAVVESGDIVVWSEGIGKFGHIAITISGTLNGFTSFDQNYPSGTPAHIQEHTYKHVRGWLRVKTIMQPVQDTQAIIDQLRKERDDNHNLHIAFRKEVTTALELPEDATNDTVARSIAATRGLVSSLQKEVATAQSEVNNQKEKCENISSANMRLLDVKDAEITGLNTRINSFIIQVDQYTSGIKILESNLREEQKSHGITKNELAACYTGNPKINCFNWLLILFRKLRK